MVRFLIFCTIFAFFVWAGSYTTHPIAISIIGFIVALLITFIDVVGKALPDIADGISDIDFSP